MEVRYKNEKKYTPPPHTHTHIYIVRYIHNKIKQGNFLELLKHASLISAFESLTFLCFSWYEKMEIVIIRMKMVLFSRIKARRNGIMDRMLIRL